MENLQITQVNDFVDNTGLSFVKEGEKGEIYYYVDGEPSGWGTAFEHFSKFPADK